MEKIWLRHIRLLSLTTLSFIALSAAIHSEDSTEIKSIVVEVESPVESDNLAAARESARKQAFEKALDQILAPDMNQAQRGEFIKNAGLYVKGFRIIDEKREGTSLKLKFKCEVQPPAVSTPLPSAGPVSDEKATFEVAWLPDEVQFNAVDLLKYVSDVMGTPSSSVRIGRGNIVLTLGLKKSIEETQTQLASFVGRRGLVKVIHQDQNRPPDTLPTPVQIPQPSPESEIQFVPVPLEPAPSVESRPTPSPTPTPSQETTIVMTPPPVEFRPPIEMPMPTADSAPSLLPLSPVPASPPPEIPLLKSE